MNKINKDNFKQDAYKYGFVTEIEDEKIPKGLNEDIINSENKKIFAALSWVLISLINLLFYTNDIK